MTTLDARRAEPSHAVPARAALADIDAFLAEKRFAMVGVSRHERDYSRLLLRELLARGYTVVPVNPALQEVENRRCHARVQEIQPSVRAALLLTPPETTGQAVRDCIAADVRVLWVRSKMAASPFVLDVCAQNRIRVISGECPFMFLPQAELIHRCHSGLRRLVGSYPR